mmetsp:Transcript_3957/g.9471  ORF Transcript_3957/g.9471 Transcript_3957/m.9471 type:complete len:235 (+) Transcript_3957:891-1595(+)
MPSALGVLTIFFSAHSSVPSTHDMHMCLKPVAVLETTPPASIMCRCFSSRTFHSFRKSICCSMRIGDGRSPTYGIISSSACASSVFGAASPTFRSTTPSAAILAKSLRRILAVRGSMSWRALTSSACVHSPSFFSPPSARIAVALPALCPVLPPTWAEPAWLNCASIASCFEWIRRFVQCRRYLSLEKAELAVSLTHHIVDGAMASQSSSALLSKFANSPVIDRPDDHRPGARK